MEDAMVLMLFDVKKFKQLKLESTWKIPLQTLNTKIPTPSPPINPHSIFFYTQLFLPLAFICISTNAF